MFKETMKNVVECILNVMELVYTAALIFIKGCCNTVRGIMYYL